MNSGEVDPGDGQLPRLAPGCEEESVIGNGRALIEPHALFAPVDLDRAAPDVQLDVVAGIEVWGPDGKAVALDRARQIFLGKGRTLVGDRALLADQDQLPREAFAA